ncbi:ATP-binding protein [Sphingomonas mollis]|uniref:histidine kinase n=1 Tax=Sphingomonas mollis TaxID=2795726 RepID=A0ABS0XTU0_9SPHN|nr:ATP-binding protein [Sphingomonas sp. BT553]MBJ6123456.1 sensor histidine kinase [Sphingomonas sp. BT553]
MAVVTGLIVNEWVTNALQHAFDGGPGQISIDVAMHSDRLRVTVVDDGGADKGPVSGQGGNLMMSLAKAMRAEVTITYQAGTRCTLMIPIDAES